MRRWQMGVNDGGVLAAELAQPPKLMLHSACVAQLVLLGLACVALLVLLGLHQGQAADMLACSARLQNMVKVGGLQRRWDQVAEALAWMHARG